MLPYWAIWNQIIEEALDSSVNDDEFLHHNTTCHRAMSSVCHVIPPVDICCSTQLRWKQYSKLHWQLCWLTSQQLAHITYKMRSSCTLAYLCQDYLPAHTSLQFLNLLSVLWMALSAKTFSINAPSVWNSLSYQCRSAKILSTFRHFKNWAVWHCLQWMWTLSRVCYCCCYMLGAICCQPVDGRLICFIFCTSDSPVTYGAI